MINNILDGLALHLRDKMMDGHSHIMLTNRKFPLDDCGGFQRDVILRYFKLWANEYLCDLLKKKQTEADKLQHLVRLLTEN